MVAPKKASVPKEPTPAQSMENSNAVTWHKPSKPNFVKIKEDQAYDGIFLGTVTTQFGVAYKFRSHDSGEIFTVGGNRAQLDQCFQELLGSPQGYVGDTIIGHALIVARLKNTESKAGRKVAVYQIGHDLARCPKGCKA